MDEDLVCGVPQAPNPFPQKGEGDVKHISTLNSASRPPNASELASRLLRHWLAELWGTEDAIMHWLQRWNRTAPVEGKSLKRIFRNFLRLLVQPLNNVTITERGLFPFGLEHTQIVMDYQSMTTRQRAAAYAAITFSPWCFETVGRGGDENESFCERGFVIQGVRDLHQLPCFPTEEFTRLFCLFILRCDIRLQPLLLSAYDAIWIGDCHCFHNHNEAFYCELRGALDAYDPIEAVTEMIYMPWDTRPIIARTVEQPVPPHQLVMRKESERERQRRMAREERMASQMAAYHEQRQRDQLSNFAIGMGLQ